MIRYSSDFTLCVLGTLVQCIRKSLFFFVHFLLGNFQLFWEHLFFYRDIFPYLDEDAQDAVFYQEEDESTFVSVPLLAQKLEKEVNNLFNNPQQQFRQDGSGAASSSPSTILVGLMETMNKVASQLLDLSETEPYGVKGARVILKLRSNNGKEQNVGSFTLDQCTVRNHQILNYFLGLLILEFYLDFNVKKISILFGFTCPWILGWKRLLLKVLHTEYSFVI